MEDDKDNIAEDEHTRCEGCGIITEPGYIFWPAVRYREHDLCSWCVKQWKELEEIVGDEVDFETFKKGLPWHPGWHPDWENDQDKEV